MDYRGYDLSMEYGHWIVTCDGEFVCSADTCEEAKSEVDSILEDD